MVLGSPGLTLIEGDAVTLHCLNKVNANITADFYKDGRFIRSSSTGNMSIQSVSTSHQGQYKCHIIGKSEYSYVVPPDVFHLCIFISFAVFAQIVPSRLQLFEHSSLSIDCEGFHPATRWAVLRKTEGRVSTCVSGWATVCAVKPAFLSDSGEYWCEGGVERSNAVNITVTAGAVILESPVHPVMEGEDVTLRCWSKMTSSAHMADFFKDGRHVGASSTAEMVIGNVSKSDEGLYRCSISEFGASPQSWLTVRGETSRLVVLTTVEVELK
uniref:Ig-like domain-containing protein n=1 Tax=Stegastes partitus TaxID=144197 RepID=A0A3B4Z6I0_9TELE